MGVYHDVAMEQRDKRASNFPTEHANVYQKRREEEMSDARITSQLAFTEEQLSKTRALISELEDRISPVLMPDYPEPTNATEMPDRKTASDLSNMIDDLNGFVGTIQDRLINISQRVQL